MAIYKYQQCLLISMKKDTISDMNQVDKYCIFSYRTFRALFDLLKVSISTKVSSTLILTKILWILLYK